MVRHVGLAVASAVVASGCNSLLGIDDLHLGDAGASDVPGDTGAFCYGTFVRACFDEAPVLAIDLAGPVNTDNDPRCATVLQQAGPSICAIRGAGILVSALTTVTGQRPLMLISTGNIMVSSKLDASSKIAGNQVGPGGNSALCAAPLNGLPTNDATGGGGGAAGGSFITMGGSGAAGDTPGAPGISATPPQQALQLRGGCAGGMGGSGVGAGAGGVGGAGGGAIYLFAAQTITIANELRASGAAGRHGVPNNSGGGGGGSGGMIVLEALQVTVTGQVVANGGGGGEGARAATSNDGEDDRAWNNTPNGGTGAADAGDGGNGAVEALLATDGKPGGGGGGGGAGGGGGGGGGGAVIINGALTGTQISPTRLTN